MSSIFDSLPPQVKAKLLEELKVKKNEDQLKRFDPKSILTKVQYNAFQNLEDTNVIVCSRRAGKSYFIATLMLFQAMNSKVSYDKILYISLDKSTAKLIIWSTLKQLIDEYKIDCKTNDHVLEITFPNGNQIIVKGAKDQSSIEKIRGIYSSLICIDECQSIPLGIASILINDIALPALMDYNGKLVLSGTPDPLGISVLKLAWEGSKEGWKGYKKFTWNVTQNTSFPRFKSGKSTPEGYLEEVKKKYGFSDDNPTFRREYLGEFVDDSGALVYNFSPQLNIVENLPTGHHWQYILTSDLGFKDFDSIVIIAYSYTHPIAYVVEEWSEGGKSVDEFIDMYKFLYDKYRPTKAVTDFGAGGLKVIESIRQRYSINAQAAQKWNPKLVGVNVLSNELRAGRFKVLSHCQTTISQFLNMQWIYKVNKDGYKERKIPDGKQVKDEFGQVVSDDCLDAILYAMKELKNYLAIEVDELTEEEQVRKTVNDHKQQLIRNAISNNNKLNQENFY